MENLHEEVKVVSALQSWKYLLTVETLNDELLPQTISHELFDILTNLISQTRQLSSKVKLSAVQLSEHILKQTKAGGYFSNE